MTIKGPLRKQVFILMNSGNIKRFMSKSSNHIANLNRALKNIKTNVKINFICLDATSIIIVTSKVVAISDLQTIENNVKTANNIDLESVKKP